MQVFKFREFLRLLILLVDLNVCIFITLVRLKVSKLILILRNGLCFKHNTTNQKTRKNLINTFLYTFIYNFLY